MGDATGHIRGGPHCAGKHCGYCEQLDLEQASGLVMYDEVAEFSREHADLLLKRDSCSIGFKTNYMDEVMRDVCIALVDDTARAAIVAHVYQGTDCAAAGANGRDGCGGCIRQRYLSQADRVAAGDLVGPLKSAPATSAVLEPPIARDVPSRAARKAKRKAQRAARKRSRK